MTKNFLHFKFSVLCKNCHLSVKSFVSFRDFNLHSAFDFHLFVALGECLQPCLADYVIELDSRESPTIVARESFRMLFLRQPWHVTNRVLYLKWRLYLPVGCVKRNQTSPPSLCKEDICVNNGHPYS